MYFFNLLLKLGYQIARLVKSGEIPVIDALNVMVKVNKLFSVCYVQIHE